MLVNVDLEKMQKKKKSLVLKLFVIKVDPDGRTEC